MYRCHDLFTCVAVFFPFSFDSIPLSGAGLRLGGGAAAAIMKIGQRRPVH